MTIRPGALIIGIATLGLPQAADAGVNPRATAPSAQGVRMAQADVAPPTPVSPAPNGPAQQAPGAAPTPNAPAATIPPPSTVQSIYAPAQTPPPSPAAPPPSSAANPAPAPTGTTRGNAASLPTLAQPSAPAANADTSSITYGGPRVDVQPVYGSSMRDSGAGNGGVPLYSSAPGTLGGPINGTANAYFSTLPSGATAPGQAPSNGRGAQNQPGFTLNTQQPLGGQPYTRDQAGNLGGRGGYTAQGVYNGTAAQSGTGYGYGSPYAPNGRPVGGLISTGVDATGPLRPYIPLNSGPIGRPNSGYGIPNGSRSTHMDGRGIQRVD